MRSKPIGEDHLVCLDTGCGMTCFDRKFIRTEYPDAVIQKIPPIEIRGLGNKIHLSDEYVVVDIYLPGYQGKKAGLDKITREVHLVNDLPCKALIRNDVADVEGFNINIRKRECEIMSLEGLVCPLVITPRGKPIEHRMVRTKRDVVLKKHSKTIIPIIAKKLPDDRDYHFKAHYMPQTAHLAIHGMFPEAVLDANSMFVTYCNTSRSSILLPANTHIGEISEWDSDEKVTIEDPRVIDCLFFDARVVSTLQQASALRLSAMQAAQVFFKPGETYSPDPSAFLPPEIYSLFPPLDECGEPPSKFGPNAVHINTTDDITQEQVQSLRAVVAEFPELWEDRIGRVIQPEPD